MASSGAGPISSTNWSDMGLFRELRSFTHSPVSITYILILKVMKSGTESIVTGPRALNGPTTTLVYLLLAIPVLPTAAAGTVRPRAADHLARPRAAGTSTFEGSSLEPLPPSTLLDPRHRPQPQELAMTLLPQPQANICPPRPAGGSRRPAHKTRHLRPLHCCRRPLSTVDHAGDNSPQAPAA